ncbi:hypothetical protein FB567DRAFT_595794 [Paraphoma chrysanthemicola]|uniref:ABM domain-containing protein n=1 Tax=Paraphoma chrysanthemicola TaxID=798071 RepID=A0A8K0QZY4_9PLEO|nr:hypothetical protein FB567DRAFT_595794 [Paraphoma chrysanthemicola]
MFIISPLSQCASPAKRDEFLSHIERIAAVTLHKEPRCHAYAWFRSADDNDEVPSHWLRGFEVYESIEANQVEHRASSEYKAFRAAVGEQGFLAKPSDLRFWHPAGIGFLSKKSQEIFTPPTSSDELQYVVTDELTTRPGAKAQALDHLGKAAAIARENDAVLSFWVQDRAGIRDIRAEGLDNNELYILVRCKNKEAYDLFYSATNTVTWELIEDLVNERRRTTWVESGLGFIGR